VRTDASGVVTNPKAAHEGQQACRRRGGTCQGTPLVTRTDAAPRGTEGADGL